MKKIKTALLVSSFFATSIYANEDLATKITNFYTLLTNNTIKFEAIKKDSNYLIKIVPNHIRYKRLLDSNATIKLEVDEGPFVFKPKFTIAKAGLSSKFDFISLFNKEIQKEIRKDLKEVIVNYEGVVGFFNKLNENITMQPLLIEDNEVAFKSSALKYSSNINLDNYTGYLGFRLDSVEITSKKEPGGLFIKGLKVGYNITNPPENNLILYTKNYVTIDSVEIKDKRTQLKFKFNINSETKKVDENYLDFFSHLRVSSDDIDTIAFAKGIKEADFKLNLLNLGKKGVVELIKLSYELDELESLALQRASNPEATAKYLAKLDEITNKLVPIYNLSVQKDKTRIKSELELIGQKKSFIKLDLLYKAPPIKGDINTAFLTLLANSLAIFDGKFEMQIDRDLITSINPFAVIVFDMLKNKGFAKEQNGIYIIKGELKDGKVIIDGKSYNLQQLNQAMF